MASLSEPFIRRPVATDPAVHLHAVAHQTTEQFIHGRAQYLALDVPQRLIDAGDGATVRLYDEAARSAIELVLSRLRGSR